MKTKIMFILCAFFAIFSTVAQEETPWNEVEPPQINAVTEISPGKIRIEFVLITSTAGSDKGRAVMMENGSIVQEKMIGRSRKDEKKVDFTPDKSGSYTFIIYAQRKDETTEIASVATTYDFSYPLAAPLVQILNKGKGSLAVSWNTVKEAESYTLTIEAEDGTKNELKNLQKTDLLLENLKIDQMYDISVSAIRKDDCSVSNPIKKLVKKEGEREWFFTFYGQSIQKEYNTFEMIDANNLTFKMTSCSYDPKTDNIIEKGGKFTAFHDGISFYYTQVDAYAENFELTATFTIDYINNTADGQEGFGLLALDNLGEYGVSSVNHYTNSAGIIATKFEETIDGTKYTSKDTLGSRFVTGLTKDVIAMGDTGIVQYGKSLSRAFSYDQSNLVKKGDVYRITLKKDNTGYHTIYEKELMSEEAIRSYTLYGPEKLLQLDSEHVYVGFACARGCNVTVSDVVMTISDPKTDPPAQEEPPELLPTSVKVDSPTTYTEPLYPFVYIANADGRLTLAQENGEIIFENRLIKADKDFKEYIVLKKGVNKFSATFTPDPDFRPMPNTVMALYDKELKKYKESYNSVHTAFSVIQMSFEGENGKLYVSKEGSIFGKGTKESPLDLLTAVNYVKPGQTIILESGTYTFSSGLVIERGNNGSIMARKTLKSEDGGRAILDFSYAGGGLVLWGNYWIIDGIDICNTDGNVKGFQVAGDKNIIRFVNTYNCGDTGLQISGTSTEPYEKWPENNLIFGCVSYNNSDPAQNNGDGFAAKLTCGNGNVFKHCIAYSNIDDGWDLYTKIETGPIGVVLIDSCLAFKNGSLLDGSGNGDGNGFKLGGDGISVKHRIKNSFSWNNGAAGITSNSNPAIQVENCILYANKGVNITIYGKGDFVEDFTVLDCISMEGVSGDSVPLDDPKKIIGSYLWNGAASTNNEGETLKKSIFVSTDMTIVPVIDENGTIDMKGLFEIKQ